MGKILTRSHWVPVRAVCEGRLDSLSLVRRSYIVLSIGHAASCGDSTLMELGLEHDLQLRATARAIYNACFPTEEWAPVGFYEAKRCGTVHYRQAVDAAHQARWALAHRGEQIPLLNFA